MIYKLQCKKKICKSTLSNSKWEVSKLKEDKEKEEYNNGVKQNMNYTAIETTDTNQQWDNLKHVIITAAKDMLGNIKQQPRKPWISEKNHNPNRTKKETQT